MKPLALGAVLALVWVLFGSPVAPVTGLLSVLVEPVTVAFLLGLVALPYVRRSRRGTA